MEGISQIAAIIANLSGILILAPILFSSKILYTGNKVSNMLRLLIIISIMGCVCDMIYILVNGKMFYGSIVINVLVKSFTYLETVLASVLFVWFIRFKINHPIGSESFIKTVSAFALGIMLVLLFSNPITGIVFSIDENNVYSRGPMGQVGFIVAFFFVIYTSIIIIKDNVNRKDYLPFPIVGYVLPFLIGGAAQLFVPQLRLSNMSFSLSMLTAYLNTLTTSRYEDEIPGVYNGTYLSYFFKRTGKIRRMIAYGGMSLKVKAGESESLIYNVVDAVKENHKPGTIIIRHEKDAVLVLRENTGLDDMDSFALKMGSALSDESDKIEIGRGVYFSNSADNDYFLDSLYNNKGGLQYFSMSRN